MECGKFYLVYGFFEPRGAWNIACRHVGLRIEMGSPTVSLFGLGQLESLQRELQHVNEQLEVEHSMTLSWKARALAAEKKLPKPKKKAGAEEPASSMQSSSDDELDGLTDSYVTEGEIA
jgi:hypothetical protein